MRNRLAATSLPLLLAGCISYPVGTTARPVPVGEFQPNVSVYFVPNGIETLDDEGTPNESMAYSSVDFDGRWGLTERSDLGLRVPSASGVILTYKRLLSAVNDPDRPAVSVIGGGGVVNFGNHFFVEGGLIASGRESDFVPYVGVRGMHVFPISSGAVSDTPTVGFFGGGRLRVGTTFSLSPELGVYYDESALGLRKRNIIFIPSITFHWHRERR
ncbi:MAG TPA: hypothetical protein VNA04_13270 [Thermoanaerobaculia bacterium]|nr:hypothetical protein [Thermoanaerobaculia bacterium]